MLLLQSRERVREAHEDGAVARIIDFAERESIRTFPNIRALSRRNRGIRTISVTVEPIAGQFKIQTRTTEHLQAMLNGAGLKADGAIAAHADASALSIGAGRESARRRMNTDRAERERNSRDRRVLVLSFPLEDGKWFNAVQPLPREAPLAVGALVAQTAFTYLTLLVGVLVVTRRLSQPLVRLTEATRAVLTASEMTALPEEGPEDVRQLTESFDVMRQRISSLFAEKDVMLGALGHDLRTPLTSLRIRVESVHDAALREAMTTTIEEMAMLLDDILSLARNGQTDAEMQSVRVDALIRQVIQALPVDEEAVTVSALPAVDISAFPTLLRRALRNLIDNAVRYGVSAHVAVRVNEDEVSFVIDDQGIGIPDEDISSVRQAFIRGEASRNSSTGGSGLGLALVDRIARDHGGRLDIANQPEGGLRAVLTIPR